jgi:hypothetical protein
MYVFAFMYRGDLDAGDKLDPQRLGRCSCRRFASPRVVICDTHDADASRENPLSQLFGSASAIRCRCVQMQINCYAHV